MRLALLVVVTSLAIGCGNSPPTAPGSDGSGGGGLGGSPIDPTATLTRVQNEIFTPTCSQMACHDTTGQQSSLVLVTGRAYDNIVNVKSVENPTLNRIIANDPANSYLYRKITGSGITGDRMPQGLLPLSSAQISLIRDWIRRGAPRD
ncbi:MAG TPA: hypothetical protein VF921_11665 [Vicinamibacterales bacterium]